MTTKTISRSTADLSLVDLKKRLQQMNEYRFEYLIADLWEEWGWQTTVTQQSNDGGIDVVAKKREPSPQKWLIQTKCYSDSLSAPELREYAALMLRNDGVDEVIVVSTAGFTKPALEDNGNYDHLWLINGDSLIGMIDERNSYDILDMYDGLQPEPIVETIPGPEPESGITTADDTVTETENKEAYIHALSEKEVAERVDRIKHEGVHPILTRLRGKFSPSSSDQSISNSQRSCSVWKQTSLGKTESKKTTSHRYLNRAFGGGCAICDTFTSLRVVSGEVPAQKIECIKCGSRFVNKNASGGYKDKAEWELIRGGDGRLGEKNPLKEWREEYHEQKMRTCRPPNNSRCPPSFHSQKKKDNSEVDTEVVTAADAQCHDLTEEEIAERVDRIEQSNHPVWKNFISSMNDGSWLTSKLSRNSVWKGTDLEESGNSNQAHRFINRIFGGRCAVCGGFASLRDISGGFFSKLSSRKAKCAECGSLFESETADFKDKTEWELIEGPDNRIGEEKSLEKWKNELFERQESVQSPVGDEPTEI